MLYHIIYHISYYISLSLYIYIYIYIERDNIILYYIILYIARSTSIPPQSPALRGGRVGSLLGSH